MPPRVAYDQCYPLTFDDELLPPNVTGEEMMMQQQEDELIQQQPYGFPQELAVNTGAEGQNIQYPMPDEYEDVPEVEDTVPLNGNPEMAEQGALQHDPEIDRQFVEVHDEYTELIRCVYHRVSSKILHLEPVMEGGTIVHSAYDQTTRTWLAVQTMLWHGAILEGVKDNTGMFHQVVAMTEITLRRGFGEGYPVCHMSHPDSQVIVRIAGKPSFYEFEPSAPLSLPRTISPLIAFAPEKNIQRAVEEYQTTWTVHPLSPELIFTPAIEAVTAHLRRRDTPMPESSIGQAPDAPQGISPALPIMSSSEISNNLLGFCSARPVDTYFPVDPSGNPMSTGLVLSRPSHRDIFEWVSGKEWMIQKFLNEHPGPYRSRLSAHDPQGPPVLFSRDLMIVGLIKISHLIAAHTCLVTRPSPFQSSARIALPYSPCHVLSQMLSGNFQQNAIGSGQDDGDASNNSSDIGDNVNGNNHQQELDTDDNAVSSDIVPVIVDDDEQSVTDGSDINVESVSDTDTSGDSVSDTDTSGDSVSDTDTSGDSVSDTDTSGDSSSLVVSDSDEAQDDEDTPIMDEDSQHLPLVGHSTGVAPQSHESANQPEVLHQYFHNDERSMSQTPTLMNSCDQVVPSQTECIHSPPDNASTAPSLINGMSQDGQSLEPDVDNAITGDHCEGHETDDEEGSSDNDNSEDDLENSNVTSETNLSEDNIQCPLRVVPEQCSHIASPSALQDNSNTPIDQQGLVMDTLVQRFAVPLTMQPFDGRPDPISALESLKRDGFIRKCATHMNDIFQERCEDGECCPREQSGIPDKPNEFATPSAMGSDSSLSRDGVISNSIYSPLHIHTGNLPDANANEHAPRPVLHNGPMSEGWADNWATKYIFHNLPYPRSDSCAGNSEDSSNLKPPESQQPSSIETACNLESPESQQPSSSFNGFHSPNELPLSETSSSSESTESQSNEVHSNGETTHYSASSESQSNGFHSPNELPLSETSSSSASTESQSNEVHSNGAATHCSASSESQSNGFHSNNESPLSQATQGQQPSSSSNGFQSTSEHHSGSIEDVQTGTQNHGASQEASQDGPATQQQNPEEKVYFVYHVRAVYPQNQWIAISRDVSVSTSAIVPSQPPPPSSLPHGTQQQGEYGDEVDGEILCRSADTPSNADFDKFRSLDFQLRFENLFTTSPDALPSPLPKFNWANSKDVWRNMVKKEQTFQRDPGMFKNHPELQPRMRSILLDWLSEVCEVYRLHKETFTLCVDFIDRYLSVTQDVAKTQLQLTGISALFIAAKLEEIYPPKLAEFAYVTDSACSETDIVRQEMIMLKALKWDLSPMTTNSWLGIFLQMANLDRIRDFESGFVFPQFSSHAFIQISRLCDLCLMDPGSLKFRYSVIAAAAMYHHTNEQLVMEVSNFNWADLYPCVKWMAPFAKAILEVGQSPIKFFAHISAEDCHNIQTHNVDMPLVDRAQALQASFLEKEKLCPSSLDLSAQLVCLLTPQNPHSARQPNAGDSTTVNINNDLPKDSDSSPENSNDSSS